MASEESDLRVLNGLLCIDMFYVEDSVLWRIFGIINDATIYHVVCSLDGVTAPHCWEVFSMVRMSWAGPPRKIILDQQRGFLGEFCYQLECVCTELDFVPRNAHHKLGRAEWHNAA